MVFSLKRASIKGFTYKIVEFVGTVAVTWAITRSFEVGLVVGVTTDFLLPYGWFLLHEYFWERRS